MNLKKQVTVRMSVQLNDWLTQLAAAQRKSLGEVMRDALRLHLLTEDLYVDKKDVPSKEDVCGM